MTAALHWLPLAQRILACEWVDRRGRDGWCETHDDPWPCGRAQEAADMLAEEMDQPTKDRDQHRARGGAMSGTTNHYCPNPEKCRIHDALTPIDPADIRPGDVVERRQRMTVTELNGLGEGEDLRFWVSRDQGVVWPDIEDGWTWHLVHRPDPDAEAVRAIRSASYNIHHAGKRMDPLPGLPEATDLLTKLREQGWDVTRRAES